MSRMIYTTTKFKSWSLGGAKPPRLDDRKRLHYLYVFTKVSHISTYRQHQGMLSIKNSLKSSLQSEHHKIISLASTLDFVTFLDEDVGRDNIQMSKKIFKVGHKGKVRKLQLLKKFRLKKETRLMAVNICVIIITFFLFFLALFVKGLTHDILLEVAIFLVSVKLILATFHIQILTEKIGGRIKDIEKLIKEKDSS